MSSPKTTQVPRPEALKKLAQLQIERLKKEDEEEQWISGEELYTEGSSDEDDAALRAKRRGNDRKLPKKVAVKGIGAKKFHGAKLRSTSATMDSDASDSSQMDKLSLLEKGKMPSSPPASEENDSEQSEISWRPKRGSIKLPNLTPEGNFSVSSPYCTSNFHSYLYTGGRLGNQSQWVNKTATIRKQSDRLGLQKVYCYESLIER